MRERLLIAEQKMEQLKKLANEEKANKANELKTSKGTKDYAFRRVLSSYFKTIEKVEKLNDEINEGLLPGELVKKIDKIIYGQTGKISYEILKKISPEVMGIIEEQDAKYPDPELLELDKCISCLYCFGYSPMEIATYLDIVVGTVHTKLSKIRKKFNLESRGNIKQFFDNFM